MQTFLTHILSGHSLSILTIVLWITEFMKSGARKKVALFVNRSMALQCMTWKYRHKNSMHTMEHLAAPLNKSATFFPSTLLNKTDVLIMKITINCKEWPLKLCIIKKLNVNFWMNNLDEILELYQKVSDGNLLFWLCVQSYFEPRDILRPCSDIWVYPVPTYCYA